MHLRLRGPGWYLPEEGQGGVGGRGVEGLGQPPVEGELGGRGGRHTHLHTRLTLLPRCWLALTSLADSWSTSSTPPPLPSPCTTLFHSPSSLHHRSSAVTTNQASQGKEAREEVNSSLRLE